ncbi:hypothetical protein [Campylobacter sp. CCUG 57310]|uniref:hypothetical protein n=1 Tax=Campylobacter sp. CCUG 57310 TaxID=2517362 RepID=UPI001C208DAC|nr:hypothetical protein [Campylobacter sp. CCUG 57310]QKF92250.1 ankyrin domain-containing protein [Campylobacter sp. CCUG 57310]
MKKIFAILAFIFTLAFGYELNFEKFYDENITNEQVNEYLDDLLAALEKNPNLINKETNEYNERIFSFFIINSKVGNTGKFDFERIEKILKFKPDLNYDMYRINNSSVLHMAIALGFDHEIKSGISEDEILKLVKVLVKHGADINAKELLATAYSVNKFEIFRYLIDNGARDTTRIMLSIAADTAIFIGQNNLSIHRDKLENSKEREFAKTQKFDKFYKERIRFLEKILKFQELKEIDSKEIELFILVNVILDNDRAIELLLQHGLCELENSYKFLKEQAKVYNSKKILKIINGLY